MICSVNIKRAYYGNRQVLEDIFFDVEEGDILAIVGESGAGKTTLGRLISGLYKFYPLTYEGKIDKKVELDVVPQNITDSLDPVFKIKEQILEICNDKKKVKNVLKIVGFTNPDDVLNFYPTNLSGGMKQRVLIAMAIIRSNFILADEFTSALDTVTKVKVVNLLKKLNMERKISLIFITHDMELLDFDGEIIILYGGKILEKGKIGEIKRDAWHPYTKFLINSTPKLGLHYTKYKFSNINIKNDYACPFYNSCDIAQDLCKESIPSLKKKGDRWIRCHF